MSSLPLWGRARAPAAHLDDAPLLLSLFNLDQLDAHARRCAASCQVSATRTDDLLVGRLRDNQRRLAVASARLDVAQREGQRLSPGAEWMLDNQHLIEEQIRLARHHLPTGYSRTLPHLTHGPLAGYPRVYHLALEVIAHVDGRVDAENLTRFVTAWQAVKPLTLGELWAIPIMLRLALIENLRRVSSRLVRAVAHREEAQRWAGLFLGATQEDPKSLLLIAADMARGASAEQRVRRRARPAPPGPQRPHRYPAPLDQPPPLRARLLGPEPRRGRVQRSGRQPGLRQLQHRQPALP